MGERERVRWRCRRGLLELDLVLGRFLDRHLEALDAAQLQAFQQLLELDDGDLLDLVMGRRELPDGAQARVLELLRRS